VEKDKIVHHRLGPFSTTQRIFEHVTGYSALLNDPATAQEQIEKAFAHCLKHRTPVYLSLPSDMVDERCCEVPSEKPTSLSLFEELWVRLPFSLHLITFC
jgi:alpha-keto-acid decarboxylase